MVSLQQSPDAVPYLERSCRYSSNNLSTATVCTRGHETRYMQMHAGTGQGGHPTMPLFIVANLTVHHSVSACRDRLSFRVRSGCGILCPLRSANCRPTVSRPSFPASHLCNSSSGFYLASLHRFYVISMFSFYMLFSK